MRKIVKLIKGFYAVFVILFPLGYILHVSFNNEIGENIFFGIGTMVIGYITIRVFLNFLNWVFDYESFNHPTLEEFNFLLVWIVISHLNTFVVILILVYPLSLVLFGSIILIGFLVMKVIIKDALQVSEFYSTLMKLPRF